MTLYRKRPVDVPAARWRAHGDHPAVQPADANHRMMEGQHEECGLAWQSHGHLPTLEGGHLVCPGDWVLTGVRGEHWRVRADIFAQTYEPVTDGGSFRR